MGRIKTKPIKRVTNELYKKYKDRFTSNFNDNKKIVEEVLATDSKKIRNVVAGYITRLNQEKAE